MFSNLAPTYGGEPHYYGFETTGEWDMRGAGFWSSLSSGLGKIGSSISSGFGKFFNSQGFQQAKKGFLDSGVLATGAKTLGELGSSGIELGKMMAEMKMKRELEKQLEDQQIEDMIRKEEAMARIKQARPGPPPAPYKGAAEMIIPVRPPPPPPVKSVPEVIIPMPRPIPAPRKRNMMRLEEDSMPKQRKFIGAGRRRNNLSSFRSFLRSQR